MPIKVPYALPRGAQRDPEFEIPIWQAFVAPAAGRSWTGRSILTRRMAQTGTPPPIRIARAGFRGPGNMGKSQCPAYRTQIRRPEFLARSFQDRLPIAASRFCYVNAVEKVGSEIVRGLPTADIPGSIMKEGCWRPRSTKVHRDVWCVQQVACEEDRAFSRARGRQCSGLTGITRHDLRPEGRWRLFEIDAPRCLFC